MRILIRGGGDLGTGVAHRLHRAGFQVVVAELLQPLVIRRAVAFATAVYTGSIEVEGVWAERVRDPTLLFTPLAEGKVPVLIAPGLGALANVPFDALVDARMAKQRLDTTLRDAPIVVGLGPGFVAGQDVHAVIETMRGHDLGRVIMQGAATPDTRVPGAIDGASRERVLHSPADGTFASCCHIGDVVQAGQTVARVADQDVRALISGVLRGILFDGLDVFRGQKVGDIDPRGIRDHCFTISDKSRAVAGGVLEAILYLARRSPMASFDNAR